MDWLPSFSPVQLDSRRWIVFVIDEIEALTVSLLLSPLLSGCGSGLGWWLTFTPGDSQQIFVCGFFWGEECSLFLSSLRVPLMKRKTSVLLMDIKDEDTDDAFSKNIFDIWILSEFVFQHFRLHLPFSSPWHGGKEPVCYFIDLVNAVDIGNHL